MENSGGIEFATKRLIDSVWTVGFIRQRAGEVKIVSYNRENPIGYEKENELLKCEVITDDERNVTGLTLYPSGGFLISSKKQVESLKVINQKYIFSY